MYFVDSVVIGAGVVGLAIGAELAKKNGKSIGVFPVNDDAWIDIGEWAEYKKAIDLL